MTIDIVNLDPKAFELDIRGRIEKKDFERFARAARERIAEVGQIGLLLYIAEFDGYSPSALLEELKFDVKHYHDVSRLALVTHDPDNKWLATLSKPFTAAEVKFFTSDQIESARDWVQGG